MGRHLALVVAASLLAVPGLTASGQALPVSDTLDEAEKILPLDGEPAREQDHVAEQAPPPADQAGDQEPTQGSDKKVRVHLDASHLSVDEEAMSEVEEVLSRDDIKQTFPLSTELFFSIEEAPVQVGLLLIDPEDGLSAPTADEGGHVVFHGQDVAGSSPQDGSVLFVVLPAAAATLTGTMAATGSSAWLKRMLASLPLWSQYSRIERTDVLDHEARESVCDALKTAPGLSIREIAQEVNVARSTARHHVRVLQDADLVDATTVGRCRIHYLVGHEREAVRRHLLKNENRARVAHAIRSRPRSVSEIAELLDENVGSVHFHLNKLCQAGLAKRRENGRVTYRCPPELVPEADA